MGRIGSAIKAVFDRPVGWGRTADPLQTLYHRPMPPRLQVNWPALVLGPFWYFIMGLWVHGSMLLAIAFLSAGLLAPFVWLYAGLKANEDLLDARVMRKNYY